MKYQKREKKTNADFGSRMSEADKKHYDAH